MCSRSVAELRTQQQSWGLHPLLATDRWHSGFSSFAMLLQRTSCKVLTLFHIYLYLVIRKWHLFVQVATMLWVGQDLSEVFLSSNQNLPSYSNQEMLMRKQKSVFWYTQSICIYKLHRNTCKTIRRNYSFLDFCQVSKSSCFLSKGWTRTYSFDSFSDLLPALLLLKVSLKDTMVNICVWYSSFF